MEKGGFFETIIGIVVVAVAAAFLYYAYNVSGADSGRDGYDLNAVFGKIDGLALGAEVRIAGVKVGAVTANALDTDTYEARVRMSIDKSVPVPEDSIAKVVSDGLLGGAHLAIEPGASEEMLRDGETITITQGSVDLLGLAVKAFTDTTSENGGAGGDEPGLDPLGDF